MRSTIIMIDPLILKAGRKLAKKEGMTFSALVSKLIRALLPK